MSWVPSTNCNGIAGKGFRNHADMVPIMGFELKDGAIPHGFYFLLMHFYKQIVRQPSCIPLLAFLIEDGICASRCWELFGGLRKVGPPGVRFVTPFMEFSGPEPKVLVHKLEPSRVLGLDFQSRGGFEGLGSLTGESGEG